MKRILAAIFVLLWSFTVPAQETITHQIGDDGFVEVPLQFVFPYYGRYFTNSWMYDNGVVGFYSPFSGYNGGQNYFSQPFSTGMGGQFSYMIAPLWTDLINYSGTFTTQGDDTFQRYSWNNISQWGYPDNLNTFSLEITPSGLISFQYDQVNITGYPVSVGMTGDVSQGEFEQLFYAAPGNTITTNDLTGWDTYTETNMCSMDVLSSPECPGYEQAYFDQQCLFDPLYDPQCSGYDQAYFYQQCSVDALYDSACPGYEVAYFDQQCSVDPMYNNQCPGYGVAYSLNQLAQQLTEDVLVANETTATETVEEIATTEQIQETLIESEVVEVETTTILTEVEKTAEESEPASESETKTASTVSTSTLALVLSIIQNQDTVSTSKQTTTSSSDSTSELDLSQTEIAAIVVDSSETVTDNTDTLITDVADINAVELTTNLVTNNLNVTMDVAISDTISNDAMDSENTVDLSQFSNAEISVTETIIVMDNTNNVTNQNSESDIYVSELENLLSVTEVVQDYVTAPNTEYTNIEVMLTDNVVTVQQVVEQQTEVLSQSEESSLEAEQKYLAEVDSNTVGSLAAVSTNDTRAVFENNTMQQVLAMGGNITQILTTVVPDFSRFEIKPPTDQEQFQAMRVESAIAGLSDEELEQQLGDRIGDMDPASQAIVLQIMAYSPGFDRYGGMLSDQTNWYRDRAIYGNNRVTTSRATDLIFDTQNTQHQNLIMLQYRR
jgi:hypothetical protein